MVNVAGEFYLLFLSAKIVVNVAVECYLLFRGAKIVVNIVGQFNLCYTVAHFCSLTNIRLICVLLVFLLPPITIVQSRILSIETQKGKNKTMTMKNGI